jgi:hypothetical protein
MGQPPPPATHLHWDERDLRLAFSFFSKQWDGQQINQKISLTLFKH